MGVLGELLPVAVGLAMLGVMPMIAAVVLMSSDNGAGKAWAFAAGYYLALVAVTLLLVAIGQQVDDGKNQATISTTDAVIQIVLGIVLLGLSYRNFRKRDAGPANDSGPGWLTKVDKVSALTGFGLGFTAGAVNPKNLALIPGAAITIISAEMTTVGMISASMLFALVGTSGVAIPLLIPLVAGDRKDELLASLRDWLTRNTAVIMMVLLLILGWILISRGITGLGSS